jgi:starvation-inducible DNA-binding protein
MSAAHADAVPAFRASDQLAGHLQRVLVDLIELHLQGKQAHWNVVGKNFRDLHLQLDEIIDAAREFSDQIAERMRALWATPDGRPATVASRTSLTPLPDGEVDTAAVVDLITDRLYAASGTLRAVHDDVDHEDPTSADIVHQIIEQLEKFAWMVSAENRSPARSPRPPGAAAAEPDREWPNGLDATRPSRDREVSDFARTTPL